MKYKLIKNYPGSPSLGSIHEGHGQDGDYITYDSHRVIALPEFWEKVVEKNYEILSFISIAPISNGVASTKLANGFHTWLNDASPMENSESSLLKNSDYTIHSIKRLSDGEIFTIGDRIKGSLSLKEEKNGYVTINKFKITKSENIRIFMDTGFIDTNYGWDEIKRLENPLFTTEDGVDIFKGDIYFQITHDFECFKCTAYCENNFDKSLIIFSTKKAAEEYILMNKPCLSLNDLVENNQWSNDFKEHIKINKTTFKNIVKSRL